MGVLEAILALPKGADNFQVANKSPARPPKLVFGRSGKRFGGLGARLDGHLVGPRDGLDVILGPLGRSGRRFGANFGGFDGPKRVRKGDFFGSKVEKCKIAKSFVFLCVFNDFWGSGAPEIDQNGVKWL